MPEAGDGLTVRNLDSRQRDVVGGAYEFSAWVIRLVFANLLWVAFTLLGLVVAGLFPATVALLTVLDRRVAGDYGVPTFTLFYRTYRAQFVRANGLGWASVCIVSLLVADYVYFTMQTMVVLEYLRVVPLAGIMGLWLCTLYVYPACAYFGRIDLGIVCSASKLVYRAPLTTVALVALWAGLVYVFFVLPTVAIVAGPALCALVTTRATNRVFARIWAWNSSYFCTVSSGRVASFGKK